MNAKLARILTRLYPRRWRERYGEEFEAMLEEESFGAGTILNLTWCALGERISPWFGGVVEKTFKDVVKLPTALIPLAMSLAALSVLGVAAIWGGLVPSRDEGATAHLWQLFMGGQLPVLAFFAAKWLPRAPKAAVAVLGLQVGAALAAMAPVFLLRL